MTVQELLDKLKDVNPKLVVQTMILGDEDHYDSTELLSSIEVSDKAVWMLFN